MQHLKRLMISLLVAALVCTALPFSDQNGSSAVQAASTTVQYQYKGKTKTYKGIRRSLSYQGKTVSLTSTPILLLNGTNMVPYYETFVKNTIKAKKSYQSKTKTLTLTYQGHKVKLQAESKTAYVDGKKKTLSTAPKFVTYKSSDLTRLLVPCKEIAGFLGLTYRWDKESGTIYLAKKTTTENSSSLSASTEATTEEEEETISIDDSSFSSIDAIGDEEDTDTDDDQDSGSTGIKNFSYTMSLKRPDGVEKGSIVCVDDYRNRRLKITMKGDWTDFYSSNRPSLASGVSFQCKYSSSTNKTTLTFTTKTIKGFQVKEDSSKIYIKHGSPKSIYKNIVVLDAGHGGSDSGATGSGYKEKNMTLSIVKAAKKYFDSDSNFKVYYTRLSDTYPSLSDRYTLANEVGADLFISVHINSGSKSATGTETLYNPDRNKKSSAGLTCYKLASITHKYIKAATGFSDRGLKKRCTRLGNGLAVLNHNNGPATLTEIGFISNASQAKKMNKNLSKYGKAIYNAVVSVSSQYPTGR